MNEAILTKRFHAVMLGEPSAELELTAMFVSRCSRKTWSEVRRCADPLANQAIGAAKQHHLPLVATIERELATVLQAIPDLHAMSAEEIELTFDASWEEEARRHDFLAILGATSLPLQLYRSEVGEQLMVFRRIVVNIVKALSLASAAYYLAGRCLAGLTERWIGFLTDDDVETLAARAQGLIKDGWQIGFHDLTTFVVCMRKLPERPSWPEHVPDYPTDWSRSAWRKSLSGRAANAAMPYKTWLLKQSSGLLARLCATRYRDLPGDKVSATQVHALSSEGVQGQTIAENARVPSGGEEPLYRGDQLVKYGVCTRNTFRNWCKKAEVTPRIIEATRIHRFFTAADLRKIVGMARTDREARLGQLEKFLSNRDKMNFASSFRPPSCAGDSAYDLEGLLNTLVDGRTRA